MNKLNNGLKITYYGHSTFEINTTEDKTIFIDPWIKDNPMCPDELKDVKKADIIAVTHGHFDHMSDVIPLAQNHGSTVISNFEMCGWFGANGVENCSPMNKGGTQEVNSIKFNRMALLYTEGNLPVLL